MNEDDTFYDQLWRSHSWRFGPGYARSRHPPSDRALENDEARFEAARDITPEEKAQ